MDDMEKTIQTEAGASPRNKNRDDRLAAYLQHLAIKLHEQDICILDAASIRPL